MSDEIVKCWPVRVRHSALLKQIIPGVDWHRFKEFVGYEGDLKLPINFSKEARQVPGGEVFTGWSGGGGPLHETPFVLLEILPIPMPQQRVEYRNHLFGRFGNFRCQARNLLFRFIALDGSFQSYLPADRLDGFRVGFVPEGALDDWL